MIHSDIRVKREILNLVESIEQAEKDERPDLVKQYKSALKVIMRSEPMGRPIGAKIMEDRKRAKAKEAKDADS